MDEGLNRKKFSYKLREIHFDQDPLLSFKFSYVIIRFKLVRSIWKWYLVSYGILCHHDNFLDDTSY